MTISAETRDREVMARTVKDFCRAYGVGHSTTYELIAAGKIMAVKVGRRTLIVEESARVWFSGLDERKPRISDCDEYVTWAGMLQRCGNPKNPDFRYYGARGIKVCQQWSEFLTFLADMGPRPSPRHSIDRINNDGNYEPGNCRWATPKQQRRNRREPSAPTHNSTHKNCPRLGRRMADNGGR